LGGVFNALVAPLVFDRLIEYPLIVVLACLGAPSGLKPIEVRRLRDRLTDVVLPVLVTGLTAFLVADPDEPIEPPSAAPSRPVNFGLGDLVFIFVCLYAAVW
jgi:hypothetical protein